MSCNQMEVLHEEAALFVRKATATQPQNQVPPHLKRTFQALDNQAKDLLQRGLLIEAQVGGDLANLLGQHNATVQRYVFKALTNPTSVQEQYSTDLATLLKVVHAQQQKIDVLAISGEYLSKRLPNLDMPVVDDGQTEAQCRSLREYLPSLDVAINELRVGCSDQTHSSHQLEVIGASAGWVYTQARNIAQHNQWLYQRVRALEYEKEQAVDSLHSERQRCQRLTSLLEQREQAVTSNIDTLVWYAALAEVERKDQEHVDQALYTPQAARQISATHSRLLPREELKRYFGDQAVRQHTQYTTPAAERSRALIESDHSWRESAEQVAYNWLEMFKVWLKNRDLATSESALRYWPTIAHTLVPPTSQAQAQVPTMPPSQHGILVRQGSNADMEDLPDLLGSLDCEQGVDELLRDIQAQYTQPTREEPQQATNVHSPTPAINAQVPTDLRSQEPARLTQQGKGKEKAIAVSGAHNIMHTSPDAGVSRQLFQPQNVEGQPSLSGTHHLIKGTVQLNQTTSLRLVGKQVVTLSERSQRQADTGPQRPRKQVTVRNAGPVYGTLTTPSDDKGYIGVLDLEAEIFISRGVEARSTLASRLYQVDKQRHEYQVSQEIVTIPRHEWQQFKVVKLSPLRYRSGVYKVTPAVEQQLEQITTQYNNQVQRELVGCGQRVVTGHDSLQTTTYKLKDGLIVVDEPEGARMYRQVCALILHCHDEQDRDGVLADPVFTTQQQEVCPGTFVEVMSDLSGLLQQREIVVLHIFLCGASMQKNVSDVIVGYPMLTHRQLEKASRSNDRLLEFMASQYGKTSLKNNAPGTGRFYVGMYAIARFVEATGLVHPFFGPAVHRELSPYAQFPELCAGLVLDAVAEDTGQRKRKKGSNAREGATSLEFFKAGAKLPQPHAYVQETMEYYNMQYAKGDYALPSVDVVELLRSQVIEELYLKRMLTQKVVARMAGRMRRIKASVYITITPGQWAYILSRPELNHTCLDKHVVTSLQLENKQDVQVLKAIFLPWPAVTGMAFPNKHISLTHHRSAAQVGKLVDEVEFRFCANKADNNLIITFSYEIPQSEMLGHELDEEASLGARNQQSASSSDPFIS